MGQILKYGMTWMKQREEDAAAIEKFLEEGGEIQVLKERVRKAGPPKEEVNPGAFNPFKKKVR